MLFCFSLIMSSCQFHAGNLIQYGQKWLCGRYSVHTEVLVGNPFYIKVLTLLSPKEKQLQYVSFLFLILIFVNFYNLLKHFKIKAFNSHRAYIGEEPYLNCSTSNLKIWITARTVRHGQKINIVISILNNISLTCLVVFFVKTPALTIFAGTIFLHKWYVTAWLFLYAPLNLFVCFAVHNCLYYWFLFTWLGMCHYLSM